MTEASIQSKIIKHLESKYDAYVVKVISANKKGISDIICCIDGHFIAIEVKQPSKRNNATKLQLYNLEKVKKSGGTAFIATSVQDVDTFLYLSLH